MIVIITFSMRSFMTTNKDDSLNEQFANSMPESPSRQFIQFLSFLALDILSSIGCWFAIDREETAETCHSCSAADCLAPRWRLRARKRGERSYIVSVLKPRISLCCLCTHNLHFKCSVMFGKSENFTYNYFISTCLALDIVHLLERAYREVFKNQHWSDWSIFFRNMFYWEDKNKNKQLL